MNSMKYAASRIFALLLVSATVAAEESATLHEASELASSASDPELVAEGTALLAMYEPLAREAGIDAALFVSDSADLNAYATRNGAEAIVVVHQGLVTHLAGDRDAVAAVLAHEIAHHAKGHPDAIVERAERNATAAAILGTVVGVAVGHDHGHLAGAASGAAVGIGADLLVLRFSRSQELEADALAMALLDATGHDPAAMIRLHEALAKLSAGRNIPLLSTHPTGKKRIARAERVLAQLHPAGPPAPMRSLVDDADIALARERIAQRAPQPGAAVAALRFAGESGAAPRALSDRDHELLRRLADGYRAFGVSDRDISQYVQEHERLCMQLDATHCENSVQNAIRGLSASE
jgi:predicted Zn-dependent protease